MKRLPRLALGAIAIGLLASLASPYALFGDDAVYIALARGIARGWGYAHLIQPLPRPETQYPPVLPLLLLPFQALRPDSVLFPRLLIMVLSGAGLLAAYRYGALRAEKDAESAGPPDPLNLLLPVLAPILFFYSTRILTEGPMLFLAYAALLSAERDRPRTTAALVLLAMLLRQAAWGLFLGLLLDSLVRRRPSQARWLLAVVLGGTIPWWGWQWIHESRYLQDHILMADIYDTTAGVMGPLGFIERPFHNLLRYAGRSFGEAVFFPWILPPDAPVRFSSGGGAFRILLSLLAFSLFALGIAARGFPRGGAVRDLARLAFPRGEAVRRTFRSEDGYLLATSAILLLHPVYDSRYLVPLLPAILANLIRGLEVIRLRQAALLFALSFLLGTLVLPFRSLPLGDRSYLEIVEVVKKETQPGTSVVSRKPGTIWFYAGRTGVSYPASKDPALLLQCLADANTPFLIVDRLDGSPRDWERYLLPAISSAGPQFALVAEAPSDSNVKLLRWTMGP